MNEYSNFTSLAPQDEASMVVFERSTQENLQKSMMIALIAAVGIGLLSVVIFFGFPPPAKKPRRRAGDGADADGAGRGRADAREVVEVATCGEPC